MFTGIVKACCPVVNVHIQPGLSDFSVKLPLELLENLETGASVAVDGVCLTVVEVFDCDVRFQAMQETLNRTTIDSLAIGQKVNIERSATLQDEIGGHIVSGHVTSVAEIVRIDQPANNHVVWFRIADAQLMQYILPKGFIALDGTSLTIVDRDVAKRQFSVWFIPETLQRTTFGFKKKGDRVNLEIDSRTQAIVDTVVAMFRVARDEGRDLLSSAP